MKSFNLVNKPWIPLRNGMSVSLKEVFSNLDLPFIEATPTETVSIFKLILAIAQSACVVSSEDYEDLDTEQLAQQCLAYVDRWSDRFDIYHLTQPFLQFPQLVDAPQKPFHAYSIDSIGSKQKSGVNSQQFKFDFTDAEIARFLLLQQGFCLGGKGVNTKISLSEGFSKGSSGCIGTNQGRKGFLHSFLIADTLIESILINLFSTDEIAEFKQFPEGLGVAVWEDMPTSELCPAATKLQNSMMGRLIPMNRFCLIKDDGFSVIQGLTHLDYKQGLVDPSVSIKTVKNDFKVIDCNSEVQGWRHADAILSFLDNNQSDTLNLQVQHGLFHAKEKKLGSVTLISLGTQIGFNAGEQYMSGKDDHVFSAVQIHPRKINSEFYSNLKAEWLALKDIAKELKSAVIKFYLKVGSDLSNATDRSNSSLRAFWAEIDHHYQDIVSACEDLNDSGFDKRVALRNQILAIARQIYTDLQPISARSIEAWARSKPNLHHFKLGESA